MIRQAMLDCLVERIVALLPARTIRVAIDGIDAAGKTTLADELALLIDRRRPVIRASVDNFHNPRRLRYRRGRLSPEGYYLDAFDYDALKEQLLDPLSPGGGGRYRVSSLDLATDRPVQLPRRVVPDRAVLIVDGVFMLRPALRSYWDLSIFLDVKFEQAYARARERDVADAGDFELERRYRKRYFPAQACYLSESRPWQRADIVINNAQPAWPEILEPVSDLR